LVADRALSNLSAITGDDFKMDKTGFRSHGHSISKKGDIANDNFTSNSILFNIKRKLVCNDADFVGDVTLNTISISVYPSTTDMKYDELIYDPISKKPMRSSREKHFPHILTNVITTNTDSPFLNLLAPGVVNLGVFSVKFSMNVVIPTSNPYNTAVPTGAATSLTDITDYTVALYSYSQDDYSDATNLGALCSTVKLSSFDNTITMLTISGDIEWPAFQSHGLCIKVRINTNNNNRVIYQIPFGAALDRYPLLNFGQMVC